MSMDDRELIEELRLYVAVIAGEVTDLNVGLRMCANAMAQAADRLSTLSTDREAIRAEAFEEAARVAETWRGFPKSTSRAANYWETHVIKPNIAAAIRALGDRK